MASVITRILLRYVAAVLITKGLLSPDMGDVFLDPGIIAGIEVAVGMLLGLVAEGWYYVAKRMGWDT